MKFKNLPSSHLHLPTSLLVPYPLLQPRSLAYYSETFICEAHSPRFGVEDSLPDYEFLIVWGSCSRASPDHSENSNHVPKYTCAVTQKCNVVNS